MRYAYINVHTDKRVLDWIDTDLHSYVLPDAEYLRPVSEAEWALKDTGKEYMVSANGSLVLYVPVKIEAPTIKPVACTPAQGLVALYVLKRITEDDVLAAISSIPDPAARYTAKIGYQHATQWERQSPAMKTIAQLLGLSDSDLDALFDYAPKVIV